MKTFKLAYSALLAAFIATQTSFLVNAQEAGETPAETTEAADVGNNFDSREELTEYLAQASSADQEAAADNLATQTTALASTVAETGTDEEKAAYESLNAGLEVLVVATDELATAEAELEAANASGDADAIAAAEQKVADSTVAVSAAETQISDAKSVLEPNFADSLQAVAEAQAALDAAEGETAAIASVVERMSDDQVRWTNQKLQNAKASGLVLDIPLEELEKFTTYNFQQIKLATKAFEAEAKFTDKGGKFAEDSKQREMFEAKAEAERDKFLSRVEGAGAKQALKGAAKDQAVNVAREQSKSAAHDVAKNVAKEDAKSSAKDAARIAAKDTAKEVARGAARDAAKDNARQAAKQIALEDGRHAGKSAAQERELREKPIGKGNDNGRGQGNSR